MSTTIKMFLYGKSGDTENMEYFTDPVSSPSYLLGRTDLFTFGESCQGLRFIHECNKRYKNSVSSFI